MSNPITGELVIRKIWDETTQAIRTIPADSTSFAIELSQADGDSVLTYPTSITVEDATITAAPGIKTVCLYIETNAAPKNAKIQISPSDTANLWVDLASSAVVADPVNLVTSGALSICARRIRVIADAGAVYHLVGQAI